MQYADSSVGRKVHKMCYRVNIGILRRKVLEQKIFFILSTYFNVLKKEFLFGLVLSLNF